MLGATDCYLELYAYPLAALQLQFQHFVSHQLVPLLRGVFYVQEVLDYRALRPFAQTLLFLHDFQEHLTIVVIVFAVETEHLAETDALLDLNDSLEFCKESLLMVESDSDLVLVIQLHFMLESQ